MNIPTVPIDHQSLFDAWIYAQRTVNREFGRNKDDAALFRAARAYATSYQLTLRLDAETYGFCWHIDREDAESHGLTLEEYDLLRWEDL